MMLKSMEGNKAELRSRDCRKVGWGRRAAKILSFREVFINKVTFGQKNGRGQNVWSKADKGVRSILS